MRDLSHRAGAAAAFRTFALTKYAGFFGDMASSAKLQAVGRPMEAVKQIREGTLFHPETGLYSKGLPRTVGSILGNLGVPLAMAALAAKANPEGTRGAIVGDIVGRTTGSLLGGPLAGMAGQIGGGMLLGNVGRELGKQFDASASPRNSEVVAGE